MSRRTERVNNLLRQELSQLIQQELRDPRLSALVTVTAVETSHDLLHARAYISVLGNEATRHDVIMALSSGSRFLRRELKARLTLKHIPEFQFLSDTSIERGSELLALMHRLEQESPPSQE